MAIKNIPIISQRRKQEVVRKFCDLLEEICKKFSIIIEERMVSDTTESVYYRLSKDKKKGRVRVSCHVGRKQRKLDFIIYDDTDSEWELEHLRFLKCFQV